MSVRMMLRDMAVILLIGAAMATSAEAQIFYPRIGSYMGPYYWGPYGYVNPSPLFDRLPHPFIGSYLPYQPLPPLLYVVPPTGLVPQPYPYFYQPPLYSPYPYIGPYYPPPYYYRYRRPHIHPQFPVHPWRRYRATPEQRQNVAPVDGEPSLRRYLRSLREATGEANPPADPNVRTP
jgi:hypothetical protein